MMNLLPKYYQRSLGEEEIFKMIMIVGVVTWMVALTFALMLGLLNNYYSGELQAKTILTQAKESELSGSDIKAEEGIIADRNVLIADLKSFYSKQIKITDVFLKTADALPSGVRLLNFNYTLRGVDVEGICVDRDTLATLRDNLNKTENIKEVDFPASNWIVPENIKFKINFKYEI